VDPQVTGVALQLHCKNRSQPKGLGETGSDVPAFLTYVNLFHFYLMFTQPSHMLLKQKETNTTIFMFNFNKAKSPQNPFLYTFTMFPNETIGS